MKAAWLKGNFFWPNALLIGLLARDLLDFKRDLINSQHIYLAVSLNKTRKKSFKEEK